MKSSLAVVAFFCVGCLVGAFGHISVDMHDISMYVLYALLLQVGISIGSNRQLKELIRSLRLKMLLVPMATISGTLLFFVFGRFCFEPLESFRMSGCGEWFWILLSVVDTHHPVQGTVARLAVGLGVGDDSPVVEYLSRDDCAVGNSVLPKIFWLPGSYFRSRCELYRRVVAFDCPLFGKGDDSHCHIPWHHHRVERTAFRFVFLSVMTTGKDRYDRWA